MSDRIVYPALAFLAAGLVALALVWPQGQGAPSPAPFGRPLARIGAPAGEDGAATRALGGAAASKAAAALVRREPDRPGRP
ncbi:MAG TPA: hypothetical protein VMU93_00410 [Caulobacteraceae bacterium]|nr:hypothetical protein [Caulobacteraceae bacterium]